MFWILIVIAAVISGVSGFLMGRNGGDDKQIVNQLEEDLAKSREELKQYKTEVSSHFEQTATLVNDLTDHYRKVHQHLATGAQGLCQDQAAGLALQSSLQPQLTQENQPAASRENNEQPMAEGADATEISSTNKSSDSATDTELVTDTAAEGDTTPPSEPENVEAPKDWAPKNPDDEGTLSDSYGLKKKQEEAIEIPTQPDPGLHEDEPNKDKSAS